MLVIRSQELRLASVGFGIKGAKLLVPLYVKEGGMVTLSVLLALIIFGSSALMLKEYLTPPPPITVPVVIPWDPTKWPLPPPVDGVEPITEPTPIVPSTPTGGGVPKPVEDSRAVTDDAGTQDDWAVQANAGAIDFDKLNKDSVVIVRNDIPDKGYIALERFPELVKRVDPVYPSIAVSTGSQGRVCLQALLDIDGRVTRVEVSQSSGNPALDDAAVTAVRQWVFTPAIAPGGKPTRVWQSCPISFRLAK
jgi:protein TonB